MGWEVYQSKAVSAKLLGNNLIKRSSLPLSSTVSVQNAIRWLLGFPLPLNLLKIGGA